MKKLLLLILCIPLIISCNEDVTVDPTVMPEATTTGANTFGCLIDGWVYVGGRYLYTWSSSSSNFSFKYDRNREMMDVEVMVRYDLFIRYTIVNPRDNAETHYINAKFGGERLPDGKVFVTRFDQEAKIISGRFEGERMTHGRFDMVYKE